MWIEPNGVVKILYNIDLDNRYDNTIYFADRVAQFNYFNSKVKYSYNKITYQRVKRNYLRVEINAENLYDCNYIMFQNTSFGNRWFYAFITKVEYLSNMVSEIQYQIDVMQTWFIEDCIMGRCLVDREHHLTDSLYANLIEEQLELGPYHNSNYKFPHDVNDIPYFNSMYMVFGCTFYVTDNTFDTFVEYGVNDSGGIVSALNYICFPNTQQGIIDCNTWLDKVTIKNKSDAIVTAFLMPSYFVEYSDGTNNITEPITGSTARQLSGTTQTIAGTMLYTDVFDNTKVGGYTPDNKKLLAYPYKMLHVTDFHGQDADYRYEFFGGQSNQFSFRFTMGMTPEPSMIAIPSNYMGNSLNYNETFIVKCYPLVGYDIDGFKMWLAQNWGTLITQGVGYLTGAVSAGQIQGIQADKALEADREFTPRIGGMASPVLGAFGQMMQIAQHTTMPSYAKNNPSSDAQWVAGLRGFGYCDVHITYNYAKRIDDYFSMYGYKTSEVKIPNINSRPHWNYIKTIGANIFGNIPADDLKYIKDIFDRGITFWKNGDEIGHYELDNKPV